MISDYGQWTSNDNGQCPSLWRHFLVYFNTNKRNALHHWIEHVNISRTVFFQLWKKMFVAFFIAKSSWCAKNYQNGCFLFVSKRDTPFPSWKSLIHKVSRCKEGEKCASAAVSKVHGDKEKQKKRRDKHTHTHKHPKIWSDQHIQNSNFRVKSRKRHAS